MKHKLFKRWVAMLLVLAMCVSCLPAAVFAEEGQEETRSPIGTEEQPLEDSSAQLGEYTPPAERPEQEVETPAEETAAEPEAPAEETEAPETEVPEAEPVRGIMQPQPVGAGTPNEGRTNAGDVTLSVPGGKTYILLGTRQQLQALDYYPDFISATSLTQSSDALTEAQRYDVMGPIWRLDEVKAGGIGQDWVVNNAELVYPGDADLVEGVVINSNGDTKDFSGYTLYGVNGKIVGPNAGNDENHKLGDSNTDSNWGTDYRTRYVGGTLTQYDASVRSYNYGKYSPRRDYVVFRSIPMNNEPWTPLMFYGTMIGVKGDELDSSHLAVKTLAGAVTEILRSKRPKDYYGSGSNEFNIKQPIISDITVNTSGEMDPSTYVGVGFFASVTSNRPGSTFSFTPTQAEVRNIGLRNVSVTNSFTGIHIEQTLVNLLTSVLGKIVGRLLDLLLPLVLQGSLDPNTNFTQSVSNLLTARQRDITNLATGSFAGRVDGLVLIENCDVDCGHTDNCPANCNVNHKVQVTSGYGYTGGFVGYCTGVEQYLPVTGPLLSILEGLLNLIPGLGLGDLITIVSHLLHLDYLIPMDYLNPEVSDCDLYGLSGNIGPVKSNLETADWHYSIGVQLGTDLETGDPILETDTGDVMFNGGFVGCKVATMMVNCSVQDSDYTVWAKKYGGGFAGVARDAVIEELLTGLGIDLIENADANLESVQVRCNILNSDVNVKGGSCLGGFNGAMANAFCVNNEVDCQGKTFTVTGAEDCVGGFVGIATLGWAMNLGNQDDPSNEDLLSTVTHLLGYLGGGNFDAALLNLLGVGKSYILGLQFDVSKSGGNGTELEVTGRDYVGGLVGQGDALVMSGSTTELLNEISYFEHGDLNEWDAFPGMQVDEDFVVTYLFSHDTSFNPVSGVSYTNLVAENPRLDKRTQAVPGGQDHNEENYKITLPSVTVPANSDLSFLGWVTGYYDNVSARPERVYAAGSQLLIVRDTTLYALFERTGAEAYELQTEQLGYDEWEGTDYVITYGSNNDDGDMRILTGLDNNQQYNSSQGTSTLNSAGITINQNYKNYLMGVTDNYRFKVERLSNTESYFYNLGTGKYLNLENSSLHSDNPLRITRFRWSINLLTNVTSENADELFNLRLQSDNNSNYFLGFNKAQSYFTIATSTSDDPTIKNIYLWVKSRLPSTYTVLTRNELTYYVCKDAEAVGTGLTAVNDPDEVQFNLYTQTVPGSSQTLSSAYYTITLPNVTIPNDAEGFDGYSFAGWVTREYREVTTAPAPLYAAGGSYEVRADTDLIALFSKTEEETTTYTTRPRIISGGSSAGAVTPGSGSGGTEDPLSNYVGPYKHVHARGLKTVTGNKYVGGVIGLADTASVTSLLSDTVGVGKFEKFYLSSIYAHGSLTDGLTVTGADYYVGGGIGLAMGGTIEPSPYIYSANSMESDDHGRWGIWLDNLKEVKGLNCVGGFAGCVGPGQLAATGGLDVKLLGLSLVKANRLLSLGAGIETTIDSVTVTGVSNGFTVQETGTAAANGLSTYCAGGFFGRSNSTKVNNCHADRVQWVKANNVEGRAGGFLGVSEVGGLTALDDAEGTEIKSLLQANNLLGAVGYLIPKYTLVDVSYVDAGYVEAAWAGGFAGDFESGTVDNTGKTATVLDDNDDPVLDDNDDPVTELSPYAVYNVDHVTGTLYAGGFGGKIYSGALADAAGGIKILGDLGSLSIEVNDLLRLVNAYIPKIIKAGVKSDRSTRENKTTGFSGDYQADLAPSFQQGGFTVTCLSADESDRTSGAAGGFVGYASGAQISYCDVTQLLHTAVTPPKDENEQVALELKDGRNYFGNDSAYAITGTRYAGGFAGFLDVGSAASLGRGLNILQQNLSATNVLSALSVVVSTVEHSDVYGGPGGFAVLATWEAGDESSEGGSGSKSATRSGGNDLTIYVVDETDSGSFNAHLWKDGGDAMTWPGQNLGNPDTVKNKNKDNHNYYTFTVDTTVYDRLIFNNSPENKQTEPLNLPTDTDTLIVYVNSNFEAYTGGYDIWTEAYTVHPGCQGNYTRNIGVLGTYFDFPNTAQGHTFGEWQPYEDHDLHYRECLNCGLRQNEADGVSPHCSYDATLHCTVCGRLQGDHIHTYGAWTKVEGENRHRRTCSVCQESEVDDCTIEHEYCTVCGGRDSTLPALCENGSHRYSAWSPVDGQNKHYRVCLNCGHYEEADCDFDSDHDGENDTEFCIVCSRRDATLPDSITESDGKVGRAGGFVGWLRGSHIQDSSSYNFSYIVGQIAAGGYAGEIEPGSVADALGPTDLLNGLFTTDGDLLSVAQDFVPSIRNSETTCIPCGGAVRANAASDVETQRGMAGGYVGHNSGGQIWGNNTASWKRYNANNELITSSLNEPYVVPQDRPLKECRAVRILSVYGAEYAGGFTGIMESANTADTGSLSLLWGLVKAENLLGALSIVYPTEENTAVYGPLYDISYATWQSWVEYIGQYGGYGLGMENVTAENFNTRIKDYYYGYHVAAGRDEYSTNVNECAGGYAGGYVGAMRTGTVTNGQAYHVKQVTAMHAAGGFAGEMTAGGAAQLGSLSLLGLGLDLTSLLQDVLDVFVPCIKNSSVHGYQSGLTVCAFGDKNNTEENQNNQIHRLGDAGGYVGAVSGGQIWGDAADASNANGGCNVENLKKVQGVRHVGGYAGSIRSGSVADADTNTDDGLFQGILDSVISTPASLVQLLNATLTTIRKAEITVADSAWGFTVGGVDELLPECAGGFAGSASGAVLGKRSGDTKLVVNELRGVAAREYAGGFVGLADVDGVATVAAKGHKTDILGLLNVGQVSVLDAFRPYIYYAELHGVSEGFTVRVEQSEEAQQGLMASTVYTGCAGGFGGAVLDGTVEHSSVDQLSSVTGPNYVGGFIGFCGKSGVADVDNANVLGRLLGLQAGVGDSFGSTLTACSVTGIRYDTEEANAASEEIGYTVTANGEAQPTAGGFIGYGDLAQINNCSAASLKYVESAGIAGGFIGRTALGYLVEAQLGGTLLNSVVFIVNSLLDLLSAGDLENLDVITLDLTPVLNLEVLKDGELLYVDLLGLKIGVALNDGGTAAKVTIGDSYVELPVDSSGHISATDMPSNLTVRLLRINHTRTNTCSVTGVPEGYDVFGGGATQNQDGTGETGIAGGFVGLNDESSFVNCQAVKCDVVRGTEELVGPFSGKSKHDSVYASQSITAMEGSGNSYDGISHDPSSQNPGVFESPAKVKLMDDAALPANLPGSVPETAEMQNPCEPFVELTLHKVWEDMDGALGDRADDSKTITVEFTVLQTTWTKVNGVFVKGSTAPYETVILTKDDANGFVGSVWTKKLVALAYDASRDEWYSYSVTEAAVKVNGEVTQTRYFSGTEYADFDAANKLTFSHTKESGYVVKITNQSPAEQTVVVDFGLPVSISVVDYLKKYRALADQDYTVAGVLPVQDLDKVSRFSTKYLDAQEAEQDAVSQSLVIVKDTETNRPKPVAAAAENDARYGAFQLTASGDKLRYVPGSMMFDMPVEIAVALRGADGAYFYSKVKVVPATMIYYEDDFISFSNEWTVVGSASNAEQDEDRPGADVLDLNNVYGYDSRYSNSTTYSLGSAKMVTVTKGMSPTASFTFTGTDFDILAVTDKTTGYMRVEVYEGAEATGTPKVSWGVDTFYGCTREEDGYIRYLCVWDENAELWRVAKKAYPELTDQEAAAKVGTTEDGCIVKADYPENLSDHTSFIVYKKNYVWTTNGVNNTLYQVPVLSSRDSDANLAYGTYTVMLKPQYAALFDHDNSDASYTLYIDGVRIYGPAQGLDEEYYLQDHEGWPQFIEMRKLLIDQNAFAPSEEGAPAGIVFVDGGLNPSISEFAQYGPNNEIYLEKDQSIAFRLQKGDTAVVDQVHVSMKQVFSGDPCNVEFRSGVGENVRKNTIQLNTASECYYDLSGVIRWEEESNRTELIVITNQGDSTLSLRNLKITYKQAVTNTNDLVTVAETTPNQTVEALNLLCRPVTLPIVLDDDPAFMGASISLESDFSLHFYIPAGFLEGKTNPYVVFTKQSEDGPVVICQYDYAEELVGETLCRRYTFRNLSAAEMGTEVTARLFYNADGEDHMSLVLPYSVRQYAMNMLEKTDDAALKTLLVDMLNYGAEAQKYFGVNASDLVNAGLSEELLAYATEAEPELENHKSLTPYDGASVWFEGCSLSLERSVTLNYYLDLSTCGLPAGALTLELSWLDADGAVQTSRIDGSDFTARQLGGRTVYVAVLDELNAAQMRTIVSATVLRKEDQAKISDTMCYSIESYAQSKLKNDPALAALILAMMKYGDAAEAYFSNR